MNAPDTIRKNCGTCPECADTDGFGWLRGGMGVAWCDTHHVWWTYVTGWTDDDESPGAQKHIAGYRYVGELTHQAVTP